MDDEVFWTRVRRCKLCGRLLFSEDALKDGYGCSCRQKARRIEEEKQPIPGQMTIEEWFADRS
jgi:hypothetical protein